MLVEIYAVAHTFAAGHRLRVAVTTSDHPVFSIPAPWLADMEGGEVTLLRSATYPSHLVLPLTATPR
jgi:predicted acyl esterase